MAQTVTINGIISLPRHTFRGTGTTAKVAVELGRHAAGYEILPEYVRMAARRVEATGAPVQVW